MLRPVLVKTSGASSNCKRDSHLHTRLQSCEGTRSKHPAAFYWLPGKKPSQKAPLQRSTPFIHANLVAGAKWSQQLIRNHRRKLGGKLPPTKKWNKGKTFFFNNDESELFRTHSSGTVLSLFYIMPCPGALFWRWKRNMQRGLKISSLFSSIDCRIKMHITVHSAWIMI